MGHFYGVGCLFLDNMVIYVIFFQLNRVKAVEKEKDDLEGVKNEAVQYLTMENEITSKKNLLFQKYM